MMIPTRGASPAIILPAWTGEARSLSPPHRLRQCGRRLALVNHWRCIWGQWRSVPMSAFTDITGGIPAEQLTPEVREALVRLADENALLRAALTETKARLGEALAVADDVPVTRLKREMTTL